MKLYYAPGACSLSVHIALLEAGIAADLVKVDLGSHTTEDGRDFSSVNPYGYVPALELDDGEVLTEATALVQYVADRNPGAALAPANGTIERYRLQAALGFINSELHKTLGALFNPALVGDARAAIVQRAETRLGQLNAQFKGKEWMANESYSVADGYLFTILNWLKFFDIDLARWPLLAAHSARVAARPAVQAALKAEGLL
jgi:glutathione S-transferase